MRVGQKSVTQSVRFRCPTSAQLSRVVKADEISELEPTQPLRQDVLTQNNKSLDTFVPDSTIRRLTLQPITPITVAAFFL